MCLARVGCRFTDPALALPGDLVCWKREDGGHIAPIEFVDEDELVHTIEGNVGRFPSKVKRLVHDVRTAGGGDRGGSDHLPVPAGRTLSVEEKAIANKLVAEGHTVEALPESSARTADFLVDGDRTELKSISNITSPDPSGALARRILEGAGQAPNIIVDLRQQSGMTLELAQRAVRRAYGADGGRIKNVRLIGPEFDVNVPRVGGGDPSPSAP